jgi:hypothetical protein
MAALIVAEQNNPIVDGIRPSSLRQKTFGLCAERPEKSRYVSVTPADENHFSLLVCPEVSR